MKLLKFSVSRWHAARRAWKPGGGSPRQPPKRKRNCARRANAAYCTVRRILCGEPVPEAIEANEACFNCLRIQGWMRFRVQVRFPYYSPIEGAVLNHELPRSAEQTKRSIQTRLLIGTSIRIRKTKCRNLRL
jgi:hypothetical protein